MSSKAKIFIFLIFVCAFAYFCWYAYFVQIDNVHESEIPLLQAQTDIKSKPDNPGGMEVLNKDKAIYSHMLGKNKLERRVRVVEDSEKPVSRESLEDLINKQLRHGSSSKQHRGAVVIEPQKIEFPNKEEVNYQDSGKKVKMIETKEKDIPNKAEIKPKIILGSYTIRVAKLKDKKFLFRGVEIFQKKYPILNRYNGQLVERNGDYFLHFASVKSKQDADKICDLLIKDGGKCSVYSEF